MPTGLDPLQNHLLAALPADEWARWQPALEPVEMPLGGVLYESGMPMSHVYFPTTSIVSLLYVLKNGASAEIAVVGNEGIVGISLFMGGETTPSRSVVQSAGRGFRMRGQMLKGGIRPLGARAAPAASIHVGPDHADGATAVCNRHHSLDQQLCRWLLLSLDRLHKPELAMTQELIANMLGVRRDGVTEAASNLQRAGLIRYRRGHITVVDRPGLKRRTCECYSVVQREYQRLLPVRDIL